MENHTIAPNESMQLLELLTLKNLCITKSVIMSPLVSDNELKAILQNDVSLSEHHIRELKALLEESDLNPENNTCS
ncbi:spore coat protein [Clostridium sp. YIM B02515]|uniref:Spore coat protein n=1 Tax=Clostridium rhizosphaerae TaxID=2803861 RepID=A0ABS1TAX2_9CLOT|nr:spore coat protein [Clostridium rhizosphaerae]MBL4935479.1 spore coat protein [Clostridium rhizosphaerae]